MAACKANLEASIRGKVTDNFTRITEIEAASDFLGRARVGDDALAV
jgi:hypothetical protein